MTNMNSDVVFFCAFLPRITFQDKVVLGYVRSCSHSERLWAPASKDKRKTCSL